MAVTAGMRLGPYEILAPLGAGGMGEVYRARDPRLGREVAVKRIATDATPSPDRLRRFETEARAAAQLAHPNVVTVFDVGTHEGHPYLVLELLEGETLRETLRRGLPPLRDAVTWALEVSRGLAAAHERGIVHRDLKPDNVFLTRDGRVKILDFGLAKLSEPLAAPEGREGPTATRETSPGMMLGTLGYMSPEQVRGEAPDPRTDVFALGVVLYEMVAGRRAFSGTTAPEVLAGILRDEPPALASLQQGVPAGLESVVWRCLAKRPVDRFSSGRAVEAALETVLASLEPGRVSVTRAVEPRGPYPGLSAFTEADAERFFGREREVEELWGRLRARSLLAVIGPSGAGKTSFVRAGVVAARPSGWKALVMTPGPQPFRALVRALGPALAGDSEALGLLADVEEPDTAVQLFERWRGRDTEGLLVVDQLEELFTQNPPSVQERFAGLLGRVARDAGVHVLLSLRDDFLLRCCEQEPLAPVLEGLTALLTLRQDDLRRALVEPAKKEGFAFEDEALVAEMLEAVEGTRGALPLLAFAVSRLWDKRDRERKLLTRRAYEEIGGVAGALAQHAEQTLERIGLEREPIVRELFRNLVTAQWTRAVADREELLSVLPDRETGSQVLDQLVDARLLTSYEVRDEVGSEDERGKAQARHRIEIVHESLLRAWPRLVRWQAQDEEGAVLRDQLKQAAHLWEEKGRPDDLLWTGTSEREFELWQTRYPGKLTALEDDFARSMREKARRKKRLVRAVVAVALVGTATVAIVVSVLRQQAVRQAERAEREARLALASKVVALGRGELERYPAATLAYARKSLEVADNAEGRRLAVEALWRSPSLRVLPVEGAPYSIAVSPDGTKLAAYTHSEYVVLHFDDGSPPTAIGGFTVPAGMSPPLAFTPRGDALLGWFPGSPIRMVSIPDGREIRTFGPRLPDGRSAARLSDFWVTPRGILIESRDEDTPDGVFHWRLEPYGEGVTTWMGAVRGGTAMTVVDAAVERLAVVRGQSVRVRPVAGDERTPEHEVVRVETKRAALAFSPDGRHLAVCEPDIGRLALWPLDPSSSRPERVLTLPTAAGGFWPMFDPGGTVLAWINTAEHAVSLWDLGAPPDAAPRLLQRPDAANARKAVFDPRRSWLVAANEDTVAFWAIAQPWPRIMGGLRAVQRLRFTSDSRRLVSCGGPSTGVFVWPLAPDVAPARTRLSDRGCLGLSLAPDDRTVLWASTRVHLGSMEDGSGMDLVPPQEGPPNDVVASTAIDASGRWGATASYGTRPPLRPTIRIWDLRTGRSVDEWPMTPEGEGEESIRVGALDVAFLADGRLIVGQVGGVRLLDPRTGESEWPWTLPPTDSPVVAVSADGRRAVAARVPEAASGKVDASGEIVFFDFPTGGRRSIRSHGTSFYPLALDATGSVLVSGGLDGAVRVGPTDGREPHLLCCHGGRVDGVAVSPDGLWIASAGSGEIRLWPMPDLSRPPLHALPYDELMAKLRALTNLQVVEDAASPTGYKLDIGPFPGWKDVPTW